MRKSILILIAMAVVIVALTALLFLPKKNNQTEVQEEPVAGIKINSPKPNELIFSPLKIEGYVNGGGWIGFEAQVGTVRLLDSKGNELAFGILQAKEEWMKTKIDFETVLSFVSLEEKNGSLVFYNENPSGDPERNKTFTMPLKLPKK